MIHGEYALGTVVPRRALKHVDGELLSHILDRNAGATAALVDGDGLGPHRRRILDMLKDAPLEVILL